MERRRELVLALSQKFPEPIPLANLSELTPNLVRAYARLTRKALARDVNALLKMGLLEKKPEGINADMDKILTFLPLTARSQAKQPSDKV